MNKLDVEIYERGRKGFALAAVIGDCRVYRGNGKIETVGFVGSDAVKDVNELIARVKKLGGHLGRQGPKRRLKRAKVNTLAKEADQ
jgi:hypothetical protein